VLQLDPIPLEGGYGREPRSPPPEPGVTLGRLGRRPIIRPLAGYSPQAGVSRPPQPNAVADQIAEREQDGVEPF
jgi:hypothetical protein